MQVRGTEVQQHFGSVVFTLDCKSDGKKSGHLGIPPDRPRPARYAEFGKAEPLVLVACVIIGLLGFAAWRDLLTRTIPDAVTAIIMLAGIAARLPDGWASVGTSAMVALLLFFLLLPFNFRGLLGGGDVKLLTALAFGLPPLASYQMLCAVLLAGGLLAACYLVLRFLVARPAPVASSGLRPRVTATRLIAVESWRIRKRAPLPYGLAIAAGASLIIAQQGV